MLPALLLAAVLSAGPRPGFAAPAPATTPEITVLLSDSEIQHIVDDRVVTFHDAVGLVVGVIDPHGRRLFVRGFPAVGYDDPVDGDTIFEIGSLTKLFTALLLSDMAHRGEVSLSDPIVKYLPSDIKLPERGGRAITLLDLATHTSGLPKRPSNRLITDMNDPNGDYSAAQLYQFLAGFELTRPSGSGYEYSDLGYALLATALVDRGRTDYETLLRSRILDPLKMKNTRLAASLEEKDRTASGYDSHLQGVAGARPPLLPGSDGMRSTANDLLDFLAANLGLTKTPLAPAMADMAKAQRPTGFQELKVGIGWHIATLHGMQIVWLSGQTTGFRTFIGYVPATRTGVVVLSNAANTIDDIGVHLLDKDTPLRNLHREVSINQSLYDNYVGRYDVDTNFSLQVTHDGNRLYIQGTGQPRAELFAENETQFFLRIADAEVAFQTDAAGRAGAVALTQDGKTVKAERVH